RGRRRRSDRRAAERRPAYSMGFLDRARTRAEATVDVLAPAVAEGRTPVFVEPSDAVVVQDDYEDLLDGPAVERVAAETCGVMEYLDRERLDDHLAFGPVDEALAYHGHCNQKAVGTDHHAVGVLRRAGYRVDPVDSTCCGMAGSFGYEREHYARSQAIADILVDGIGDSDADGVVAPGTSCRTQLSDRADAGEPAHPIEKVEAALQ
ncbi:(Fe-S)-binding protein, partial [Halobacterium bonnevillei]